MTSKFTELAIDCADPGGLARFWCSVLGYEVQDGNDGIVIIGSPMAPEGKNPPWPGATDVDIRACARGKFLVKEHALTCADMRQRPSGSGRTIGLPRGAVSQTRCNLTRQDQGQRGVLAKHCNGPTCPLALAIFARSSCSAKTSVSRRLRSACTGASAEMPLIACSSSRW